MGSDPRRNEAEGHTGADEQARFAKNQLNSAVFAPTPSASDRTTIAVQALLRASRRIANLKIAPH